MAQQRQRHFSEAAGQLRYETVEICPQRHLHVCTIRRKEREKSATSTRHHATDVVHTESSTTIFLIHGVGGSTEVWKSQFDLIQCSAVDKIVAIDLIGHGQSTAPSEKEAYHFEAIAEDIKDLFTRFRSVSNILIGHSYGCRFATLLAHQYPDIISKLVLISIGAPVPLTPHPGCLQLPNCCLSCLRPVLTSTLIRQLFYRDARRLSGFLSIPPGYVLKNVMMGQDWLRGDAEFYASITVETLLIHGRQDRLVAPSNTQLMHEIIPQSRLEIVEDAGHMVMMEQPQQVNKCLRDFLFASEPASELH